MDRNYAAEYRVRKQREDQVAENVREMEERQTDTPTVTPLVDEGAVAELESVVTALRSGGWLKLHAGALTFLEPILAALQGRAK